MAAIVDDGDDDPDAMPPSPLARHLALVDPPTDLDDLDKASLSDFADQLRVVEILHQGGPWGFNQVLSGQILDGRRQLDVRVRHVLNGSRRVQDPERAKGVEPMEPVAQDKSFADPIHVDRLGPVPHEQNHRVNRLASRTQTIHGVGAIRSFVDT